MPDSQQGRSRPKSTHKENDLQAFERWRREEDEPSERERLAEFDDEEAAFVRLRLVDDPEFQAKARRIAAEPPDERSPAAEREAESYAPYRAANRAVLAKLLLDMAEEPWRSRGSTAWLFFANRGNTALWVEDPTPDNLAPSRVRERWDRLADGVQSLAWFGANQCIGCGERLAERHYRGAWNRRSRRKHCDACPKDPQESLRRRREANMRQAFDVLTGGRQRYR